MHKDSLTITALHVLLNDEWKGNQIVWLGDECDGVSPDSDYEIIRCLYGQIKEHHSVIRQIISSRFSQAVWS